MTSTPWASTPSVKAATSSGPDGRMSRATHAPRRRPASVAGEGDAEGAGDLGVELVGNRSSDVVRLDDLVENGHGGRQAIPSARSSSLGPSARAGRAPCVHRRRTAAVARRMARHGGGSSGRRPARRRRGAGGEPVRPVGGAAAARRRRSGRASGSSSRRGSGRRSPGRCPRTRQPVEEQVRSATARTPAGRACRWG